MTLESNYFIEESEETCFNPIIYDIETKTKRNKENYYL